MPTRHPAFWRYTAFQVPGWLLAAGGGWWLHRALDAPPWVAAGLPVAWVIKDYALYPLLRSAYEADHRRRIEHLVGAHGTAVEPLDPSGYVRVRGELWRARPDRPAVRAGKGCRVEVTGADGATLVVAPLPAGRGKRNDKHQQPVVKAPRRTETGGAPA